MSGRVFYYDSSGELKEGTDLGICEYSGHKYRKLLINGEELYISAEYTYLDPQPIPQMPDGFVGFTDENGKVLS